MAKSSRDISRKTAAKKQKGSAARKAKAAPSRRANVRATGDSGGHNQGFGLSGAGGNRAALQAAGSPEAKAATPFTNDPNSPDFGKSGERFNPNANFQPMSGGAATYMPPPTFGEQNQSMMQNASMQNQSMMQPQAPPQAGGVQAGAPGGPQIDVPIPDWAQQAGQAIQGGVQRDLNVAGLPSGGFEPPAGTIYTSPMAMPGAGILNPAQMERAAMTTARSAVQRYLKGANLKAVWKEVGDDILQIGKLPDKATKTGAKTVSTKTMKILESAYNKVWADRSTVFKRLMIGGTSASIGTGSLSMWWNKESADGFDYMSSEFYDNARFAKSPEERAILLRDAEAMHLEYMDSMTRGPIEWVLTFTALVNLGIENIKSLKRANTRATVRMQQIRDVDALMTEMGDAPGEDETYDTEFWAKYQENAHAQELAETEATKQARIDGEKMVLDMRAQASAAERDADLAYYDKLYTRQAELEKEKLAYQKEYWTWYFEYSANMRSNNAPSNLGFGLL